MQEATSGFSLTALGLDDAAAYNAFLRQGTLEHPDTLRISPTDIAALPFKTVHEDGTTFAARAPNGALLGVVTVERELGREKRRHIAWILRMYVKRESSGHGLGRALLSAAIARARKLPGVTKLNLTVAAHNEAAVHLYTSFGFREFSREVDAFRDTAPRTELTLSLAL